MDTTLTNHGALENRGHSFPAQIGNKDFEFTTVDFDDRKVTAAHVALAVGKHPIEDYVVLVQTKAGELETLRPTETTELNPNGKTRLFVVKGDQTFRFFVEGLAMEWPARKLFVWQIKLLAGADDDQSLVLERPGDDAVFEDDEEVDIGDAGAERFKLRMRKKTVTVLYGETEFELERRIYRTEELISIFGVPAGYLLDIVGADGAFRELAPNEPIKVKNGLEFASHPPVGQSS